MLALWFVLLALIACGSGLAKRTPIPEAIMWCALGLAVAFVPGVPLLRLNPQVALYLFLPPLLYASAVDLPWPDFRNNLRPIALLAVGLVIATTVALAVIMHALTGMPWGAAVVLAAVISPTDVAAAAAVANRVGVPHRVVSILQGEGLVNDAVALTTFSLALAAAASSGMFPIGQGIERFLAILVGEPVYGVLLGALIAWIRAHITDPKTEIAVSLLTPFAAFIVPEMLGGSGVLATVAAGMYIGERRPALVAAGTRLRSTGFWDMVVYLVNGSLFLMAGATLRYALENRAHVLVWGLVAAVSVSCVRFAWTALTAGVDAFLARLGIGGGPLPDRHLFVIAWSGMRGPISLAAALSIPAQRPPLPQFETILPITAVVIVFTLVLQGTALPFLVRGLGLSEEAEEDRRKTRAETQLGEREAVRTALETIDKLESEGEMPAEALARLRQHFENRLWALQDGAGGHYGEAWSTVVAAERKRVLELHKQGRIGNRALTRVQRLLDLRESMLDSDA